MKKANISELKNRLSEFLRLVRRGQSVLVYDRDRVIARLEPVGDRASIDAADWTAELERVGVLRRPSATLPSSWLEGRAHTKGDVVAAVLKERESGR